MDKFFVDSLHARVAQMKQEEFAQKPIKVLGEVILLLEAQHPENIVKIDFTEANPVCVESYRGYYSDLSLDYDAEEVPKIVKQVLAMFKAAVGSTFQGYRGGNFTMHNKTLVWVAPYGRTGRMLTNIKTEHGVTIICTQGDDC